MTEWFSPKLCIRVADFSALHPCCRCTWYKTNKFLRRALQCNCKYKKSAMHLRCRCTKLAWKPKKHAWNLKDHVGTAIQATTTTYVQDRDVRNIILMMPSSLKKKHTHNYTTTEQNKNSCVLTTQHTKKPSQQQHNIERLRISRPSGHCHLLLGDVSVECIRTDCP